MLQTLLTKISHRVENRDYIWQEMIIRYIDVTKVAEIKVVKPDNTFAIMFKIFKGRNEP